MENMKKAIFVEKLRPIIEALKEAFKKDLTCVVLFGSKARGDDRKESDWDLFVVIKELPQSPLKRQMMMRKTIYSKFNECVNFIAKTEKEFEEGFPPFYLDLGLDGLILYDPNGYMSQRLQLIKKLIEDAGISRIRRKDGSFTWKWKTPPKKEWRIDWNGVYAR